MKPVKTRPRFRCDFCKRVSTEEAMRRHERICWRNPDRTCDLCGGTGTMEADWDAGIGAGEPCYWCAQFDPARAATLAEQANA